MKIKVNATVVYPICIDMREMEIPDGINPLDKDLAIQEAILEHVYKYPSWFGKQEFHDSHKSNLLRKDPKHYGQFNWNVKSNLPYYWPTKQQ